MQYRHFFFVILCVSKMSDFVHEQIVHLNHVLSNLFQNIDTGSDIGSNNDPMVALNNNDQQLFLTCISREIDLLTTMPDISVVKKYLELYIQHPMQGDLAWLFIAKSTVAVYGFMLNNILNSTLPLSEATNYWNSVYGSKRYETYYALQSESNSTWSRLNPTAPTKFLYSLAHPY